MHTHERSLHAPERARATIAWRFFSLSFWSVVSLSRLLDRVLWRSRTTRDVACEITHERPHRTWKRETIQRRVTCEDSLVRREKQCASRSSRTSIEGKEEGGGVQNEKERRKEKNKKKPGIQRVLHLSYDRTDSGREYPIQCRSINRDHRVRHCRPRFDGVSTTMTTTTAGRYHHLPAPRLWELKTRLSIMSVERYRLTRRWDEQNETKTDARIVHDSHVVWRARTLFTYLRYSSLSKVSRVDRDDRTLILRDFQR